MATEKSDLKSIIKESVKIYFVFEFFFGEGAQNLRDLLELKNNMREFELMRDGLLLKKKKILKKK